jgi:hypothetical protein
LERWTAAKVSGRSLHNHSVLPVYLPNSARRVFQGRFSNVSKLQWKELNRQAD